MCTGERVMRIPAAGTSAMPMKISLWMTSVASVTIGLASGSGAIAGEARSYAADLATMYNEYQRVLTLREGRLGRKHQSAAGRLLTVLGPC